MECFDTIHHNIHQMKDIGTFTVVSKILFTFQLVVIECRKQNLLTTVEVQALLFGEQRTILPPYCL